MVIGLIIILALILILPFVVKFVEHNLEYFLFIMGLSAAIVSGIFSGDLVLHILGNHLLYLITGAVLVAGLLFRLSVGKIKQMVAYITKKIPLKVFLFLLIVILGLISSVITAIIASLILVEIIHALPLKHKNKVLLAITACFSIGLGAALTPLGEPLSTIVISALDVDFFYLLRTVGIYIIPGIVALGIFGAIYIDRKHTQEKGTNESEEQDIQKQENQEVAEIETLQAVFVRAFKVFIFVLALELLGAGFKPLINTYVIHWNSKLLYWVNMSSAVLDNATLAAAEISPLMSLKQIQAILMGLLISGGMLIPGNIPNIISAAKLKIGSREWARFGIPLGLSVLAVYYIIIFVL